MTDDGPLDLAIPRDRAGTFEPQLIPKHARRFTGFDDQILARYARGRTVREIQAFLSEMYALEVPPDLISTVTDAVHAEVSAWQQRALEPMYPVVCFDARRVKIRDEGPVRSKPSISRWPSCPMAVGTSSASGSSRRRAPSFGARSSPI